MRREGLRQARGCGCPPTPPLYIGARERGAGPLDPIWWEGGGQGGWLAPQVKGGAPSRVSPNPKRMGPRGRLVPSPLRGWFPSTYSP